MKFFDTHLHCDEPDFNPDEYVAEATQASVFYLLACGCNLDSSEKSGKFAEKFDGVWFSVGLHPHEASAFDGGIERYATLLNNPKCVAIGEIGLDYYYMNSEKDAQKSAFRGLLELALQKNRPAIVHCRASNSDAEAFYDCHEIIANFANAGGRFLLHSYTGTPDMAKKFLELGGYFGVSGMISFPKADNIRETFRTIPIDRIVLETDAPYLAPVPYRGKKNRSSYLPKTAEALAATIGKNIEQIASATTDNAFKFFNLNP